MKKIFTGVFLTLCLFSCKKDIDSTSGTEVKVKKEFDIQLWEKLSPNGGELQMIVNSIDSQACADTRLDYYVSIIDTKVTVTLKSFTIPTNCTGPKAKTSDTLLLGRLQNGVYKLSINLKDAVLNNGSLTVTNGLYIADLQSEHGFKMDAKQLTRIPANTIWGYINYDVASTQRANLFVDSLKAISQPTYLTNGQYGHFTVSNEVLTLPVNVSKTFFFRYEGTDEKLEKLMQYFRFNNTTLNMKVFSQTGKQY
ncbi:MAG: hypothetical protein RL329_1516 [Bacteroidota bacterium]